MDSTAGGGPPPWPQGLASEPAVDAFWLHPFGDLCKSVETGSPSSFPLIYFASTARNWLKATCASISVQRLFQELLRIGVGAEGNKSLRRIVGLAQHQSSKHRLHDLFHFNTYKSHVVRIKKPCQIAAMKKIRNQFLIQNKYRITNNLNVTAFVKAICRSLKEYKCLVRAGTTRMYGKRLQR